MSAQTERPTAPPVQYSVGRDATSRMVWWETWQALALSHTDVRAATAAETEIMERLTWETDQPGDVQKLAALLASGGAA